MNSKDVVQYIEDNIQWFEYAVLKNVSLNEQEFIDEMNKSQLLQLVRNNDGIISHITQQQQMLLNNNAVDNSKNTTNFDLHTDGPYYTDVPELIALYCENPGTYNAITYIADTTQAFNDITSQDKELLNQLEYTYIAKDGKLYPRKLIEKDPLSWYDITNMSSRWFFSPFAIAWQELPNLFTASETMIRFKETLEKNVSYEHSWEKWDLFIFNNNKYLHWRKWTKADPTRHLRRIWIWIKR